MVELLGWVGAIAFAVSPAPQAYKCYKQGHSNGFAHSMLWLWLVGEVFTLAYIILTVGPVPPLMFNYGFNLLCLFVIMWYRYLPRRDPLHKVMNKIAQQDPDDKYKSMYEKTIESLLAEANPPSDKP